MQKVWYISESSLAISNIYRENAMLLSLRKKNRDETMWGCRSRDRFGKRSFAYFSILRSNSCLHDRGIPRKTSHSCKYKLYAYIAFGFFLKKYSDKESVKITAMTTNNEFPHKSMSATTFTFFHCRRWLWERQKKILNWNQVITCMTNAWNLFPTKNIFF